MGKDSLIKSTAKKKTKTAQKDEAKKKPAAKATTKAKKTAKPKAAKKTPAKTVKAKSVAAQPKVKTKTAKPAVKKSASPAKPKAKPKAAPKKVPKATIPELLAKKFDPLPGASKPKPAAAEKKVYKASPPFVSSSDSSEAARIRALLATQFSMAEIKAAAKPPEPKAPQSTAPETPQSIAPETPQSAAPETPQSAAPETQETETPSESVVQAPAAPADAPPVTPMPIVQEDAPEPISRAIKYGIAAMVLLVLVLLGISNNNSSKYYLYPKEGELEIWKGCFSPKDTKFYMVLPGVSFENEVKAVYSKNDVYPIIFDYHLEQADTLLEVPGLPDLEGIKSRLYQAESYAITAPMKENIKERLNSIERMILLYKVQVAIRKNTADSLEAALKNLQKASALVANPTQQQEIDQTTALVKQLQTEIQTMPE
jgi:hypothetical protein